MERIFRTDWLASRPVFYNEKTLQIDYNINNVIDWKNVELHPEGLSNYLRFGYSVFGQTPVKYVKFLPPDSEIFVKDGKLNIVRHEDAAFAELGKPSMSETDVIDYMRELINEWEDTAGDIIVPTSGGYDSRLLNALLKDKSKVHSFSYGFSPRHPEVLKGAMLCKKLGIRWDYVELGKFHEYMDDWNRLFGISTHAHGMYQMEFYHKIMDGGIKNVSVLSGIVGDLWAGSIQVPPLKTVDDLVLLGYTHNETADCSQSLLGNDHDIAAEFFRNKKDILSDPLGRILETVRLKLILLSYLMRVPASLGFKPWSPFLDRKLAVAMLNLPQKRREHRIWQAELFRKMGLDLENMPIHGHRKGHIVLKGLREVPLKPLDVNVLREAIRPDYVEWINRELTNTSVFSKWYDDLMFTPYIKEILRRAGFHHRRIEAYSAYLTLRPLQSLLLKRNEMNGIKS